MQMRLHGIAWASLAMSLALFSAGCGVSDPDVQVADLNRVLDIFEETIEELDAEAEEAKANESEDGAPGDGSTTEEGEPSSPGDAIENSQLANVEVNPIKDSEFIGRFHKNLNDAKLVSSPIGLTMTMSGSIVGFADKDSNDIRDATEKKLFEIQVDGEQERLIASDDQGYNRDRPYRPRMGGFFTGYMIGSMMNRQNSYYSGARSSMKPNFRQMKMSPENYHSQAVTQAKTAARRTASSSSRTSSRTRTGSRSFSMGK